MNSVNPGTPTPYRTPEGEAAFIEAYDAALDQWPVPFEELYLPSRFGLTHVVASGPEDAPPLVLLHGFSATALMWLPHVAAWSREHRVYAVDVVGQASKSIPDEPIRAREDYVEWLTTTLDQLGLDRVSLVGMSYGGWLSLLLALHAPERVAKIALLSPAAGFLPLVKQFTLRMLASTVLPARLGRRWFLGWMGFGDDMDNADIQRVVELMILGGEHFRMDPPAPEAMPAELSDEELESLRMPVLLIIGEDEVIYDAARALARARRLVPDLRGELIPGANHDACVRHSVRVVARVLDFLGPRTSHALMPAFRTMD